METAITLTFGFNQAPVRLLVTHKGGQLSSSFLFFFPYLTAL